MPLGGLESVRAIDSNSIRWYSKRNTHDDVNSFVQVDDDAILIDYGDGGDATFREHVDDIKHGRIHGGSRNWVIRVLSKLRLSRQGVMFHVSADAELAERKMEGVNVPKALRRDEKSNDKIQSVTLH